MGRAFPVLLTVAVSAAAASGADLSDMVRASGVRGGLVVHLGCGDGRGTARLRLNDSYLVHGLDTDVAKVSAARRHSSELDICGPVSVDTFDGKRLPYADNLVNLIVSEGFTTVPEAEIMRCLAPLGVAYVGLGGTWRRTTKPWPDDIDEWPQYLHYADNNAVARDAVVGPPRHLQWVNRPSWSRSHMAIPTVVAMVSSRGRIFTIEDTQTPENPFLPGRFAIVARDAFNGIELWRRRIPVWESMTRYVKDIAIQLQRRLVAAGDTVYCTPGIEAPVTAFDAATGEALRTCRGTEKTQEFALAEGVVYAVVGDRMNAARYNIVKTHASKGENLGGFDPKAPFGGTGFRGSYAPESPDKEDPVCSVVALDAESGRVLWRTKPIHGYTACTLAIRGRYAVYQSKGGLFCLDRTSGREVWSVDKRIASGDGTAANTLVLTDDTVYVQEGRKLHTYSLADGSHGWEAPIAQNYEKSADLFVAAGAVWVGGARQPASYDIRTGKQLALHEQRMTGPMGHDRCYRNFITDTWYINSKTGGADFVRLEDGKEFPHHWTRGTCGMGVLPANGLLYAPPYSCQCSAGEMVSGFNAYASEPGLEAPGAEAKPERAAELVKGPAFGAAGAGKAGARLDDWPTYRHDGTRGGVTKSEVPTELKPLWTVDIGGTPTSPVVAAGKVFVADVHAHAVRALDADDGSEAWTYRAGGRVDSPPTYHEGLVIFGSRDGWLYALRASDGELAWRFKDLPDRMVGAFGQLESAWPVSGSVLVKEGVAYFAAGRSSFLDGGISLYALDARTGEVRHSRVCHGPFEPGTGFPKTRNQGSKADVLVTDGRLIYMRNKAFKPDLSDAGSAGAHVNPASGFLDGRPQHRTYWTVNSGSFAFTRMRPPSGDILLTDGSVFYEVQGFPVDRHSYFDPRVKGYKLFAGTLGKAGGGKGAAGGGGKRKKGGGGAPVAGKWSADIPLTGKAIVLAGDVVFVAGTPMHFPPDHPAEKYEAAYAGELGGVLWAASADDGRKLGEYKLDAAPSWDGMAAAGGRLYISTADGKLVCMGAR
ncbi:MAG: outer membrane protein assembly factor BamB family protein [Planctomycetota bacterium]|jgi:outer membrane protein assembly factor BamB